MVPRYGACATNWMLSTYECGSPYDGNIMFLVQCRAEMRREKEEPHEGEQKRAPHSHCRNEVRDEGGQSRGRSERWGAFTSSTRGSKSGRHTSHCGVAADAAAAPCLRAASPDTTAAKEAARSTRFCRSLHLSPHAGVHAAGRTATTSDSQPAMARWRKYAGEHGIEGRSLVRVQTAGMSCWGPATRQISLPLRAKKDPPAQ